MAIESTSSSRCVMGKVTATHDFEVTNFSALDGMGIGEFVSSSTFSVGGCDWWIDLYPDGNHMMEDEGESPPDRWGWDRFIEKSSLQEPLRLSCSRFTIRCVLTIKQGPHTEDAAPVVVVPQPKLQQDLTDMLRSGEGADVMFSVGDQLLPTHRCILAARSMVFKAELFGAMKEKDAQRIEINDMEPAVFETLLHFVYADSLPDDDCDDNKNMATQTQHLFVAANRYGLDRLSLLCEAKLCRDIDVQTVATTLALAEQHHCTQLKDACIGFIASCDVLGDVMKTDGFKHLITSCPSIMEEILDRVAAVWSDK